MQQNKNSYASNTFGNNFGNNNYASSVYSSYPSPGVSVYSPTSTNDLKNANDSGHVWGQNPLKVQNYSHSIWDQKLPASQMNMNAPSYFPSAESNATSTNNTSAPAASDLMHSSTSTSLLPRSFLNGDDELDFGGSEQNYRPRSSYTSPSSNQVSNSTINTLPTYTHRTSCVTVRSDTDLMERDTSKLKNELALKEQLIKSLTAQIEAMKTLRKQQLDSMELEKDDTASPGTLVLPENYKQLFNETYKTLTKTKNELNHTKDMLEAIVVGVALGGATGNPTISGQHDPQELGHKIVTKISMLQTENEQLLRMVSLGNRLGLLAEIGLLRKENEALKMKN
ncbi:hypothetical protein QFC19_005404 [Naganishia cerealis]|uniref:Uncharacterized protein n=1 Tax=Naganishia cerealis TaxID=610337 RepID=A0ACC2VPV0_9TREE|nr:hypothetical protein QFC19_005404 [Naganishia cerealis]